MKKILFIILIITLGFYVFGQVNTGIIAKYLFNGNANDEIGTHNGYVFGASLTTDRFGNDNAAYHFDSNYSQYIEVPYSSDFTPGSNAMSISLWFLSNTNNPFNGSIIDWYRCGANPLCSNPDAGLYRIALHETSRLYFDVRNDNSVDSFFVTLQSYNDNYWHHVVLVFDPLNNYQKYYLDNKLLDSINVNISSITDGGIQIPLEIGRTFRSGWASPSNYYNGKIDDIEIYRKGLSAYEVDSLFQDYNPIRTSSALTFLDFSIIPNPTSGIFNIKNNSNQLLQFTLYNFLGEKIYEKSIRQESCMIDLSLQPTNIYYYRFISDINVIKTGKLIKY